MKKIVLLIAIVATVLAGCGFSKNSDHQSINIKKTDEKYQFKASFPERKMNKVFLYLKGNLNEEQLFNDPNAVQNSEISLGDTLRFHFESEPGFIEITFRKTDNSSHSYEKLEQMCNGIKYALR